MLNGKKNHQSPLIIGEGERECGRGGADSEKSSEGKG